MSPEELKKKVLSEIFYTDKFESFLEKTLLKCTDYKSADMIFADEFKLGKEYDSDPVEGYVGIVAAKLSGNKTWKKISKQFDDKVQKAIQDIKKYIKDNYEFGQAALDEVLDVSSRYEYFTDPIGFDVFSNYFPEGDDMIQDFVDTNGVVDFRGEPADIDEAVFPGDLIYVLVH